MASDDKPKTKIVEKKDPNITKVKAKEPNKNPLEIKEVQDNMGSLKDQILKNQGQWMTPDLLQNVQKNPKIMEYMNDPEVMQAVNMMQSNPDEAKKRYGKNPKVMEFYKMFGGLMGNHYEN